MVGVSKVWRCIITTKQPKGLKILFADDEQALRDILNLELRRLGHDVVVCNDGRSAIQHIERQTFDCVIVDLNMPACDGIQVITRLKELSPDTEAVVLTGKSTVQNAVAAFKHGASDFLTKPYKLAELQVVLDRVAEKRQLVRKLLAAGHQLDKINGKSQLVGESAGMRLVRELVARVATVPSTVLIRGETGTGKELVAQAIHRQSPRAKSPFVAVNCGALPETLIESELFGHRKGAFTGADQKRIGLFEVAHGGTIFLDEIGELPKAMQAKLLRVLESGEVRRLGENEAFQVDIRVLCATHRDLEAMVEQDLFREDLLFRINAFEIQVPALRERREDIEDLARHLLPRFVSGVLPNPPITQRALAALKEHTWPGNVRELANVLERAAILCDQLPLDLDDLPDLSRRRTKSTAAPELPTQIIRVAEPPAVPLPTSPPTATKTLQELEVEAIQRAIERHQGNRGKAAEELGINVKTLYNKLVQLQELKKTGS
jgi:DNA-binding NtrC family response regulator